ncbi:MAG: hypothetical protein EAZ82_07755 [Verrucomicrobia bacterium]|nr:MAG: hypothetical protein EAZ82_07755 [Verrucomicrobiota bacterium]
MEFVKSVPDKPVPGTLYVSMEYASVVHLCCCGCGSEIVTPLSPKDWKLTYNGETVTLHPSIGNWSFPCRSHYWIRGNRVKWSYDMTDEEVRVGRGRDRWIRTQPDERIEHQPSTQPPPKKTKRGFLKILRQLFD